MARTSITVGDKEWKRIRQHCRDRDLKISGFLRKCALNEINKGEQHEQ